MFSQQNQIDCVKVLLLSCGIFAFWWNLSFLIFFYGLYLNYLWKLLMVNTIYWYFFKGSVFHWVKCPYSELFCATFPRIRTEYGEILRISPYSVRMRENADQNNFEYGHFLRTVPHLFLTVFSKWNITIIIYLKVSQTGSDKNSLSILSGT